MATTVTGLPSEATSTAIAEHLRRRGSLIDAALLAGIVIAGAVLRSYAISSRVFWFDETVSIGVARLPWLQFLRALWGREAYMAFYFLLLRAWLSIGSSELFIRSLSVIFSVATIPVVFALGARLFNRKTGFVAAWFLAVNAFHISYAQEVRGYALVVFLTAVATLVFVRNLQDPPSAHWRVYTLLCVLSVYSHFFGGLVVLAHCVSLLFLEKNRIDPVWRDLLHSLMWFSTLIIPVAAFVVKTGPGPINWIEKTRADTFVSFLIAFAGEGGRLLLLLDAIAIFMAGLAWFATWRTRKHGNEWPIGLAWAWFLVPMMVLLGASVIQPLFVWRYFSPCLPPFALLLAVGIDRIRPAVLAWILAAGISLAAIAGTVLNYGKDVVLGRDNWRNATSFIFDHSRPGDDVFFFINLGHIPFEYYRSIRQPMPEWPKPLEAFGDSGLTYHDFQFEYFGDSLAKSRVPGNRVWLVLVYDSDPDGKPNRASLVSRAVFGSGRHLVDQRSFSGVTVLLYSKDD